jgi:hypothetical protein
MPPRLPKLDIGLLDLAEDIRTEIRDDWDNILVATGREGIGKSSFLYWICKLVDEDYKLRRNISYNVPDVLTKIKKFDKYSSIHIDEGSDIFYKRDSATVLRKKAIKTFIKSRQQNLFCAFAAPRLVDLDENLRNWRIRTWVKLTARGKGEVYTFDDDEDYGDPWHLKNTRLRSQKNFIGTIKFPDFPNDIKKEYQKLKRKAFLEDEKQTELNDESYLKKHFITLIQFVNNLSYDDLHNIIDSKNGKQRPFAHKEIGGILGVSQQRIAQLMTN